MTRTAVVSFIFSLLALGFAAGCSDDVTGPIDDIVDLADVDDVVLTAFPSRIEVVASGQLPDSCTTISDVDTDRDGNVFNLTIETRRPGDAVCAQVQTPFTETIVLDPVGLAPGRYRVVVNGVEESFTVPV